MCADRGVDDCLQILFPGHVAGEARGPPARGDDLVGHGLRRLGLEVADHDGCACAGEDPGDTAPDPRAGAGNDGHLPRKGEFFRIVHCRPAPLDFGAGDTVRRHAKLRITCSR
jgi:hypothetical protein